MPRPTLPPTPKSSTDIAGKSGRYIKALEPSFSLPPPALAGVNGESVTPGSSKPSTSTSPYQPPSPTSPFAIVVDQARPGRRWSSSTQAVAPASTREYTLPPPPTRSRKIIQMKPRPQQDEQAPPSLTRPVILKAASAKATTGKKKPPSTTSVAGRKIARKTAHSLIERRRRSKMNEEFGVLKHMIPACKDQEMHKLAILQASIEYTRYLEQCIVDLKASSGNQAAASDCQPFVPKSSTSELDDKDDEMEGQIDQHPSNSADSTHQRSGSSNYHPDFPAMDPYRQSPYSTVDSANTSPNFEPQHHHSYTSISSLTSPALTPQNFSNRDLDHEATEALMLLNTDRRSHPGSRGGRGMSVRDLLSG